MVRNDEIRWKREWNKREGGSELEGLEEGKVELGRGLKRAGV